MAMETAKPLESTALDAIAAAFHRRGKAFRYQAEFSVTREIDAGDECLRVDYSGHSKCRFRLSVWSTGDWWFLACQRRPGRAGGWLFKHELRGELDQRAPEELVKSFEDALSVSYWSPDEQLARLRHLWDVERKE